MSEQLRQRPEQLGEHNPELKKLQDKAHERAKHKAESARHEHAENIGEIRSRIESAAKAKHEHAPHKPEHHARPERDQTVLVNAELKDMAYRRTLRRTQAKLSAPDRTLSKVIHHPVVEAVSEVAGKTVARPSGILAGGIFAFIGSSAFLWIARHYGYEYNYLLFALFFIGGFFVGLLLELFIRVASKRRSL